MKPLFIKIRDEKYKAEALICSPFDVNIEEIQDLEFYHENKQAERRRKLTEKTVDKFSITCKNSRSFYDDEVPENEINAEKVVGYKRMVLTDKNLNVIYGHKHILMSRNINESVIVYKINEVLSFENVFVLQVRHAAKEGRLLGIVRAEVIRTLYDDMEWDIEDIQLLMRKLKRKEVLSELEVGRIFEKNPGYKTPFTGFELNRCCFSSLNYLVGNKAIYDEMQSSEEKEKHFLNMAITNTKLKNKRLNTEIPPIMNHPETRDMLFTQGLLPAKELLKARYPEENQSQSPYLDIVSANKKLKNTEMLIFIRDQMDKNPVASLILCQVIELNTIISGWSPNARKEILRSLYLSYPQDFADIIIADKPDILTKNNLNKKKDEQKYLKRLFKKDGQ